MKKKSHLLVVLILTLILPVTTMILIGMSGADRNTIPSRPLGPGDIYEAAGFPCITAHSTTRALYASYNGPLYQVIRQKDSKTLDIGVVQPSEGDQGGYANAAAQDVFCANTVCRITVIYDQSGHDNHLVQAPPGTFTGPAKGGFNTLPIADMAPITIMGHKVYGTYIMPGMGLRNNDAKGLAINDEPEGIYMVLDGSHYDSGCCFNYGNTSTNSRAVGRGTMSTVYFGTSTAWGRGNGPGPWIMSDMEAGLFSGYNTKQNIENPTIDSWRFVTGMVNGGGGNQWEIRGGNAQEGKLSTFYKGIRPQSLENNNYFPMHKKGSVQMGNGGDNGNGSAGTFYEGIVTSGYPTEAAINAVQENIVAARYDVPPIKLSRVTTFTPESVQAVTITFTNTTGAPVSDVKLSIDLPDGWLSEVAGIKEKSKTFSSTITPGENVKTTFNITSPKSNSAGYLKGNVIWKNQLNSSKSETTSQRIRNALPIKINEVRLNTGSNPTDQFIELYNASDIEVDISDWSLIHTRSGWAPVELATIPAGTKLAAKDYYLLGLAGSGLASPAKPGETIVNISNTDDFEEGQQINIDGEVQIIKSVGMPASEMTAIFIPVSTGPWLLFPAGTTNLPVINTTGFEVGQKIGIDLGGNYEEAMVTRVGKAATLTTLSVKAKAGDTTIKVAVNSNMTVGDILTIGTGARKEQVKIKRLINIVEAPVRRRFGQNTEVKDPGEVELETPLKFDHMSEVDVSDRGTGISFSPATRFEHKSGDAVQALGSGITLEPGLGKSHKSGTAVLNPSLSTGGYQGSVSPNQWYGASLSTSAGSIALMDASGEIIVDAMVYGSQQSNSSANGTITSPEIATLEGNQSQGGCIVVVPDTGRGFNPFASSTNQTNKSMGRFPDGDDTDSNCNDFLSQNTITLLTPSVAGSNNIKVARVENFITGQKIFIGSGSNKETAFIKEIGTGGGTTLGTAIEAGTTVIPVFGVEGFNIGQSILIGNETNQEKAVVASIKTGRRRFGNRNNSPTDTVIVSLPLKYKHSEGVQVSGSGITLTTHLTKSFDKGTQVAGNIPTPGEPNQYVRK